MSDFRGTGTISPAKIITSRRQNSRENATISDYFTLGNFQVAACLPLEHCVSGKSVHLALRKSGKCILCPFFPSGQSTTFTLSASVIFQSRRKKSLCIWRHPTNCIVLCPSFNFINISPAQYILAGILNSSDRALHVLWHIFTNVDGVQEKMHLNLPIGVSGKT